MTLSDRIKEALRHAGKSQSQLAVEIGISTSAVSQLVTGQVKSLKAATATKMAQATGVSAEWLVSGSGSKFVNTANTAIANVGSRRIPLISYVQAGGWTAVTDRFEPGDAEEFLLTDQDLGDNAFALEIVGESMLPDFQPGDRVIIDPAVAPQPGDFVVARNGELEATFKKYRPRGVNEHGDTVFELVPLNEDYPSMRSDATPIQIIGTMIEHRKYRKRR